MLSWALKQLSLIALKLKRSGLRRGDWLWYRVMIGVKSAIFTSISSYSYNICILFPTTTNEIIITSGVLGFRVRV